MFVDARSLSTGETVESGVCVVGAGAAGISIAHELAATRIPVCLVEGGGLEPDEQSRSLYEGERAGFPYEDLSVVRLRYFGGSTNHWAGYCRALDANDFEVRDWIPASGWPFSKRELDPWYVRAHELCELGPFSYDADYWAPRVEREPIPFHPERFFQRVTQFSPPTRFGVRYRQALERAPNVAVFLNANLLRLEADEPQRSVRRARFRTLNGVEFTVRAHSFVLACGGIENPRLLLLSKLGNDRDLVGRYFMEHTNIRCAKVLTCSDPGEGVEFYQVRAPAAGPSIQGGLGLRPEVQRSERVANVSLWLEPYWKPQSEGMRSVHRLQRDLGEGRWPRGLRKHLGRMWEDSDDLSHELWAWLSESWEEDIGACERTDDTLPLLQIRTVSEQVPNPESRVTLAESRDALGLRRTRLEWRLTELDKRSIYRSTALAAQELGRMGLGRVRLELPEADADWPPHTFWGHHHMGTTRMHDDPLHGVVDRNGRVHGLSNLYVAGSSVFPTVGSAGPTLTIVALAARLADHLRGEIGA